MSADARVARWMGVTFAVLAVLMVPWTIHLALALPNRSVARHYAASWAGFDIGLGLVLAWTAFSALRRTQWLAIAASVNAAMLIIDVWFDVLTAPNGRSMAEAIVLAALVELPLAAACLWMALNAGRTIRH